MNGLRFVDFRLACSMKILLPRASLMFGLADVVNVRAFPGEPHEDEEEGEGEEGPTRAYIESQTRQRGMYVSRPLTLGDACVLRFPI